MDFKYHLETAWKLTLKYIVPLILMTLVLGIAGMLTLGILTPIVMAGYMQSILRMIRDGREPRVQDLFSEMRLFLPLLAFGLVVLVAVWIGLMLFFIPGILVVVAVSFGCLYVLPLMTDKNLGIIEAVKESWAMATRDNIVEHIIVMLLFLGISSIGGSVLLGWLFTQPLATVFLISVYYEKTSVPVVV